MLRVVGVFCLCALALGLIAGPVTARRASFPGPAGRLVFAHDGALVSVNPDGSDRRTLVARSNDFSVQEPASSPDGNRIVFANRIGGGRGGITIVNADGTVAARVTRLETDTSPTFAPDGRRLAFVRVVAGRNQLVTSNLDGSGVTVLTTIPNGAEDPDWSPDGTRIAFSNCCAMHVVNADGSNLRQLAQQTRAKYPSWSPDGSRIAYSAGTGVGVLAPDGGAPGVVVGNLNEVWDVAWSPDGSRIAFVNDGGTQIQEEVYIANADGSNVTRPGIDVNINLDWARAGAVPPPVVGKSVNVAPVSGVVRVRLRGTNRFVNLARLSNVPVGSELDVTRGRVRLVSASGGKKTQSGVFYQGRAIVRQARAKSPVTTLAVSGPLACPKRSPAATKPPRTRRLWGNAKGRFTTKGRYASAAVRGTIWLTEDRCDGTLIRVRQGRVEVLDQVRNRRVTVRAGQSYLAQARP